MSDFFRLCITQRVDASSHGERRDALDQAWSAFADALGSMLVPLPNLSLQNASEAAFAEWFAAYSPDAVIFSGGNTPRIPGATSPEPDWAPERDSFETLLLTFLPQHDIPILGVCRGMQMINLHYGGTLVPVKNHVAERHSVHSSDGLALPQTVNSFHNYGIQSDNLGRDLKAVTWAADGTVEAFLHRTLPVAGVMWHPERERPFVEHDIRFIKEHLKI